jgi:ribosomal protein L39E
MHKPKYSADKIRLMQKKRQNGPFPEYITGMGPK